MSVAKGLAAGYLPLGAAIYSTKVADTITTPSMAARMTGHTFTGHTACCAAGVAVQKIVAREKLVERVAAMEPKLRAMIADATARRRRRRRHSRPRLSSRRSSSSRDRKTKAPFDAASSSFIMRIRQQALENGLICYPVGGNADGIAGDCVILAPPYNASEAELTEIVEKPPNPSARCWRRSRKRDGLAEKSAITLWTSCLRMIFRKTAAHFSGSCSNLVRHSPTGSDAEPRRASRKASSKLTPLIFH